MNYEETAVRTAEAHHRAGRLREAELLYRQVLSARPDHPMALYGLGALAAAVNRPDVATELFTRAIAVKPDLAEAHNDLANLFLGAGRLDDAIASYRRAVAADPKYASAHSNLCNALRLRGLFDEAIDHGWRALTIDPRSAFAATNLGNALLAGGQVEEAVASHERAAALQPNSPEIAANLGAALEDARQHTRAIECYRRAIALRPDFAMAHWNLGCALLLTGGLENGWRELEWRWKWQGFKAPRRTFTVPQWRGEALNGRRILLHAEQGFGDAIQFVRYAPIVARMGGCVILEAPSELTRLFANGVEGVERIVRFADPLPAVDLHCPLLSIPLAMRTTVETIPADVPYLRVDPAVASEWRARVAGDVKLKIGIAWAGRATHENDRNRSLSVDLLSPLRALTQFSFYSLQKGHAPPSFMNDLTPELHDFADTAAMIENLDLVISVDTSIAHLAGAMGKRTWTLLPYRPEWRWMLDRTDSPWYPTMRLFRQNSRGDWAGVISNVVDELEKLYVPR